MALKCFIQIDLNGVYFARAAIGDSFFFLITFNLLFDDAPGHKSALELDCFRSDGSIFEEPPIPLYTCSARSEGITGTTRGF